MLALTFICLATIITSQAPDQIGDQVFIVGRDLEQTADMHSLYVFDVRQLNRKVFRTYDGIPYRNTPRVAPGERIIALTCMKLTPEWYMSILNTDGKEIACIPRTGSVVSWSPDGSRLAFTKRTVCPGEEGCSLGTWLYDLKSSQEFKISDIGWEVGWNRQDGNLYVAIDQYGSIIKRYDFDSGSLVDTGLHGIHFSPDGKYYWAGGEGVYSIYTFPSNKEIGQTLDLFELAIPRRWLGERTIFYEANRKNKISKQMEEINCIFDCQEGTLREVNGTAVAFADDGKSLILAHPDHSMEKVDVSLLKIVEIKEEKPAMARE